MADQVKAAGELVTALFQAIEHGQNRIASVPGILKQVIQEDAWRQYALPHSSVIHIYSSFREFVEDWLRISLEDLKAICTARCDYEALDLVDKVTKGKQGQRNDLVDNVNYVNSPDGNANTYALRKLRKDRPDLHAKVIAGELTPNSAMVEAGFRQKQITIVLDAVRAANAINRHFNDEQRKQIVELIGQYKCTTLARNK